VEHFFLGDQLLMIKILNYCKKNKLQKYDQMFSLGIKSREKTTRRYIYHKKKSQCWNCQQSRKLSANETLFWILYRYSKYQGDVLGNDCGVCVTVIAHTKKNQIQFAHRHPVPISVIPTYHNPTIHDIDR